MQTCEHCEHWRGYVYPDGSYSALSGPCVLILPDKDTEKAYINVVTDYPEFIELAVVNTRRDFGCNQFEQKQNG